MKKFLFLLLIAVMLFAFTAVSADDLADVKQAGVLRFGAPLEYIPFVFEDESGNPSGMDVALMEEVCRRMGVKLQKLSFARDGMIDALNIGQIDVIGGGLSKTDARAERIDFTRTYYNGEAQFISLKTLSKPQVVNLDSFRGLKIAVVKGSSFQDWVQKNLVDSSIIAQNAVYTFSDSADGIKALDRKDVDLIIIDQDVFELRYQASGNYQVFYSGFNTENYGYGVRKGSTLRDVINTHLNDMIKDGTAQSIANRFFAIDYNKKDATISKPVATLAPVVTAVPASSTCVNAMSYVADVTVKDGSVYNPGAGYRKTWRIYNNGSCTWDTNYSLQLVSGDAMGGSYVRIPTTVKPGQTIDISADLTAPNAAGNYKGYWQMRSPQGTGFGQTIWVAIRVNSTIIPTATPSGQTRRIPVINYFYADNNQGHLGDGTTVYWSVSNAAGVTITCNGATIENSSRMTGSAPVNAVLQRPGIHEIKLTAHSVTDDTSSSLFYTMYDQNGNSGEGQQRRVATIDYFYSDSDEGYTGDAVTIYWGSDASGVTINVDGYDITNSTGTGSYTLQAPVQGTGAHTITLIAHTVTDDTSRSITYYMNERSSYGGGDGQTRVVPSVDYVYISPDSGYSGEAAYLYWSTTNAVGVTISVDGYTIDNSSETGSYTLQAPLSGVGTHTITVTAQSVTDSASASCTYTTMERTQPNHSEYQMTEQDWQEINSILDNMTEEDWSTLFDSMTEEDWAALINEENW